MSGEDRVFMQWPNGDFITLTDPDLILLVRAGGVPETVEFRGHDEGYITDTLYDPDDDADQVDLDLDDICGQLDRMVDKGELTRESADSYLKSVFRQINLGGGS
jgi:hypothetical protein